MIKCKEEASFASVMMKSFQLSEWQNHSLWYQCVIRVTISTVDYALSIGTIIASKMICYEMKYDSAKFVIILTKLRTNR